MNKILAVLPKLLQGDQVTELSYSVQTQRLWLDRLLADDLRGHLLLVQHQGHIHRTLAGVPDGRVEYPLAVSDGRSLLLDCKVVVAEICARFQTSKG